MSFENLIDSFQSDGMFFIVVCLFNKLRPCLTPKDKRIVNSSITKPTMRSHCMRCITSKKDSAFVEGFCAVANSSPLGNQLDLEVDVDAQGSTERLSSSFVRDTIRRESALF